MSRSGPVPAASYAKGATADGANVLAHGDERGESLGVTERDTSEVEDQPGRPRGDRALGGITKVADRSDVDLACEDEHRRVACSRLLDRELSRWHVVILGVGGRSAQWAEELWPANSVAVETLDALKSAP